MLFFVRVHLKLAKNACFHCQATNKNMPYSWYGNDFVVAG
jgi:hypothetical protein